MTRVAKMFSKVMLNFSPIKSLTVCTQMTSTGSMRIKINELIIVTHNLGQRNLPRAKQMIRSVRPYETREGMRDHLKRG